MEFNTIKRGNKRSANDEKSVYEILDAGFLCHIAFQHEGQTMMIPTAYGRKGDTILIHGSTKNFMMNQLLNGQKSTPRMTIMKVGLITNNFKKLQKVNINY